MPTRLNYTARRKLTSSDVGVRVFPDDGKPATFEVEFDLASLRPHADDARIFVEAYHQSMRMRFDYGTVAIPSPPALDDRRLYEFESWQQVLFRVKITDVRACPGKLVAWRNHIRPLGPKDAPEDDLIRFVGANLEGRLWDLEFDDRGPIVLIDRTAGDRHEIGANERFVAAAYPEILRRTLFRAFVEEKQNGDDEEHWSYQWVEGFLKPKLHTAEPPGSEEDLPARLEWIEDAVQKFARANHISGLWGASETEQM